MTNASGKTLPRVRHGVLIGLLASVFFYLLHSTSPISGWEDVTWDMRVRSLAKPGAASERIRVIYIDQPSIEWVSRNADMTWPWMRQSYGHLLAFCQRGDAAAFAFDLTFSERSREGEGDDDAFGMILKDTLPTALAVATHRKDAGTDAWPDHLKNDLYPEVNADSGAPSFRASFPVPVLATSATLVGSVQGALDPGATIRRSPVSTRVGNRLLPSLAWATLQAAGTTPPGPVPAGSTAILRYRGPTAIYKSYNASEIIRAETILQEGGTPDISPDDFKDCYVFLGTSAPDLLDLKPTPISRITPGVFIHATLLDNLLSDDLILPTSSLITWLLFLSCTIIVATITRLATRVWVDLLALAFFLPVPWLASLLMYQNGYWLPVVAPTLAILSASIGGIVTNYALEGRQKLFIKKAFSQYLSPIVIDQLIQSPDKLNLGGERRELSIYFSDVQGFTTISEALTPEQLTALLNKYLTAMTDIILESGGTVDKYEGDAIIAFWNAPLALEDHAERAVRAALKCQDTLDDMRDELRAEYGKDIYARIGLNTGDVVVGNMGSTQRFDYTFLGDAGNLAARLEGINKQFGTFLMISEDTRNKLPDDIIVRELSRVRVVGRSEPVRVYEPLTVRSLERLKDVLPEFDSALQEYYKGHFNAAREIFEKLANVDPVSKTYASHCEDLATDAPENWEGIRNVTEK